MIDMFAFLHNLVNQIKNQLTLFFSFLIDVSIVSHDKISSIVIHETVLLSIIIMSTK